MKDGLILTGQLRIVRHTWSNDDATLHHEDVLQQGWRDVHTNAIVWKPVPIVLEKDLQKGA